MSLQARAYWVTGPTRGEIREEPLPEPSADQVLVQALYSGVSRGSESLVFHGKVPPSEYQRMRCPHQAGEFPAPVKYGYASVGRVLAGPEDLQGRDVFCLHPHQTAYVVSPGSVCPLPPDVSTARAVLAANMETCVNALWDARPQIGDRVSVVGAGVVGCLCAYLAVRVLGVEVELVDPLESRRGVADRLGVRWVSVEGAQGDRDLVFHTSGQAEGLRTALGLAAAEGQIVELSWFGTQAVELPLGEAFHARRLALRASQVGTLSRHARGRFTHRKRLVFALGLCRDPALDVLFSSEGAFTELPLAMPEILGAPGALCHRIRYA